MEKEININNIKEILLDSWYLEKATNDFEAEIIAHYGKKFDSLGWTSHDSKIYHMTKIKGGGLTGYGSLAAMKVYNCVKLTFDEFAKLAFDIEIKVDKQPIGKYVEVTKKSPLNIESIHKVLLKYIGEEEADDIIKELKQLK